jgi:hypothetical protein
MKLRLIVALLTVALLMGDLAANSFKIEIV